MKILIPVEDNYESIKEAIDYLRNMCEMLKSSDKKGSKDPTDETIPPPPDTEDDTDETIPPPPDTHTWDPRIHSKNKTTIADGSYKLKRGVDPELVAQVLTELSNKSNATPPGTNDPVGETTTPPAKINYTDLCEKIINKITSKPELKSHINTVLEMFGVKGGIPGISALAAKPENWDLISIQIDKLK